MVIMIVDGQVRFIDNHVFYEFWKVSVENGPDFEAYFWRQFTTAFCIIR